MSFVESKNNNNNNNNGNNDDDNKNAKEHLGLVVVGHVDAGKSTTTARLIYELGGVNEREMDKIKKKAIEEGKESFGYAWLMDKTKQEREKGITIQTTTKQFFTQNYHYSITCIVNTTQNFNDDA